MPEESNNSAEINPEENLKAEEPEQSEENALPNEAGKTGEDSVVSPEDAVESVMTEAQAAGTSQEATEAEISATISDDEIEAALRAAQMPAPAPSVEAPEAANGLSISADEIEAAMQQMLAETGNTAEEDAAASLAGTAKEVGAVNDVEAAMAAMLEQAEQMPAPAASAAKIGEKSSHSAVSAEPKRDQTPDTEAYEFEELGAHQNADISNIDLLDDVELEVKIELGRTEMYIEDVLGLGPGSVVELDRAAGDPVDIYVNERLVARGEVLVLNDNFCVRINDILSPIPELEGEP